MQTLVMHAILFMACARRLCVVRVAENHVCVVRIVCADNTSATNLSPRRRVVWIVQDHFDRARATVHRLVRSRFRFLAPNASSPHESKPNESGDLFLVTAAPAHAHKASVRRSSD